MNRSIIHHLFGCLTTFLLVGHIGYGQETLGQNLSYDHIVLFANDYALKDSLDRLFTPAEKLTTEHKSQGTIGYYYLFYNTYIELLFVQDTTRAKLNQDDFGSDYLSRWNQQENLCPIGFGMIMNPWDTSMAYTEYHKYINQDSLEGEYYLMSRFNSHLSQPLIYISMPHRAYQAVESLEDTDKKPKEIRSDLRKYLSHECQVKRLSKITYSCPNDIVEEGNLIILRHNTSIHVERSDKTFLTLVFDSHGNQQKELQLNEHTKLVIQY